MNLPRRILFRLRRRMRRRYPSMYPTGPHHQIAALAGRCGELPPPRKNMKLRIVLLCLFVIGMAIALNGCAESHQKTTGPDGSITETWDKRPDPLTRDALYFAGDLARAYSPRRLPDRRSGK